VIPMSLLLAPSGCRLGLFLCSVFNLFSEQYSQHSC
jgi:hypothetical protein